MAGTGGQRQRGDYQHRRERPGVERSDEVDRGPAGHGTRSVGVKVREATRFSVLCLGYRDAANLCDGQARQPSASTTAAATSATTGSPRYRITAASTAPRSMAARSTNRVGGRTVAELPEGEPRAQHGRSKVACRRRPGSRALPPRRGAASLSGSRCRCNDHQEADDGDRSGGGHERP